MKPRTNPELVIFTGPMFSSKTTRLLDVLDRSAYQKRKAILFKASMDNRYSTSEVCTHSGTKMKGIAIDSGSSLLEFLSKSDDVYDTIAVDEAFMIDGIADVLVWLFKKGINVYVSSLSLSYNVTAFNEMSKLLPWATRVEVCAAVCTVCGSDAFYTYKKQDDGQVIAVGGDDMYEPRCWAHHLISEQDD
jgi:thymidine kinase